VQQREDLSPVPLRAHMHANPAFRQMPGFATSVFGKHLGLMMVAAENTQCLFSLPFWGNDPI